MIFQENDFDYEEYKKRLEQLVFKDDSSFGIQCSYSVLYCILYEFIKYALLEKVADFYICDFLYEENLSKNPHYISECKKSGGKFQLAYLFYELQEEQIKIIEKAKKRRGAVVHEFLSFFLSSEHITFLELKKLFSVAKFIDNYYIINIEIPVNDEIYTKDIDYTNAHSVYFLVIEQVAEKVFSLEKK